MLSGSLAYLFPGNPHLPNISVYNSNPSVFYLPEQANKYTPAMLSAPCLNPHSLPQVAHIVTRLQEAPIHSRGRYLQGVPPGNGVVDIKEVAELSMDARKVI
jgi:hypothetical protein